MRTGADGLALVTEASVADLAAERAEKATPAPNGDARDAKEMTA